MSRFASISRSLVTFLFVVVVTVRSVAQPALLTRLVQEQVDRIAPGVAIVGTVVMDNSGRLNIRDLEIQDAGVPLARVSGLRITPDWTSLLGGTLGIRRIDCEEIHVRFVRNEDMKSRWEMLGQRITNRMTGGETAGTGSGAPGLEAFGPFSIRHYNLVAEDPRGGLYTFLDIDATGLSIHLDDDRLHIGGLVHGEFVDPVMTSLSVDRKEMRILIHSDRQNYDERLMGCLPQRLRHMLQPWGFEGSYSAKVELHATMDGRESSEGVEIEPREIAITPPGFSIPLHVYEGRLSLDETGSNVDLHGIRFEARGDDGRPVATGSIEGRGSWMHLAADIRQPSVLAPGLPPRMNRIMGYTGPDGPFTIEWHRNGDSQSLEARFRDLNFTGMSPGLYEADGVVTCDFPVAGDPNGVAEFSRLTCLDLDFTRVTVPFVDRDGLELGPSDSLVAAGPRAHLRGTLKASQGKIRGTLLARGIDLRSWIRARGGDEDFQRINGVLNGTLRLDAPEGAPHDATIGTFDFRVEQSKVTVSSNWLPLVRLIKKPTDLLTLPIRALGGRSSEEFAEQVITGGKGRLTLNPNKMLVDAVLTGDPFNFEVTGKVRFSNRGELNFKPVLLTRYDPTILLMDLVPIPFKWPKEPPK